MLNSLTGSTTPKTYTLRAKENGAAGLDSDNNGTIDEYESFITLETTKATEALVLTDLRQALQSLGADKQSVDDKAVVAELTRQYDDPSLRELGIINGKFGFELLSTYRHKQSFSLEGEDIKYTLQFDPEAPTRSYEPERGSSDQLILVKDAEGVLHWVSPEAPEPAPLPEGAVSEVTQVAREGVLLWLWPGEVPQPSDKVLGTAEEIEKQFFAKS